ncbi:MAG TPA: Rrf2 family transcriptional regulator [Chloroflexi bacterium]|nr:Rrf2 family transcriptional regulator [Chloroflexota bacterium]
MIRVRSRTDYAVRILLAAARHDSGKYIPGSRLQAETNVPRAFFRRIVAQLANLGLLETVSGPRGGIRLARPMQQINLREVVEGMEGRIAISECIKGHDDCSFEEEACPTRFWWQQAQDAMLAQLEAATLDRLAVPLDASPSEVGV